MTIETALAAIVGPGNVLTGADMAAYARDWTGKYHSTPRAVVRPGTADEVAALLRLASSEGIAVVPAGGRTGLTGGTHAEGASCCRSNG